MSDRAVLICSPETVETFAGAEPVEVSVGITNISGVVDRFTLSIEGVPGDWVQVAESTVAVYPGESGSARVGLMPPRREDVLAGDYPVVVRAASGVDATDVELASLLLRIRPTGAFEITLIKSKAVGARGTIKARLINNSDGTMAIDVGASDPTAALLVEPAALSVEIPPYEQRDVVLRVRPRKRPLTGKERMHKFAVEASPASDDPSSGANLARRAQAEFVYRPPFGDGPWKRLPQWVKLLLSALIPILAALLFLLTGGPYDELKPWADDHPRVNDSDSVILEGTGDTTIEPPVINEFAVISGVKFTASVSGGPVQFAALNEVEICNSRDSCQGKFDGGEEGVSLTPDKNYLLYVENEAGRAARLWRAP